MTTWRRLRPRPAILAALVLMAIAVVEPTRASLPEQLATCQDETRPEPERIAACTAVIDAKSEADEVRAEALLNRGSVYEALAKNAEALADYNEAARLNPDYPAVYNFRGGLHQTMGSIDLAIADYTTSIGLDPKEAYAYSRRGRLLLEKGDVARALADLDAAIANDAADTEALIARATLHERQGRRDAALRDYRRALDIEADNADALAGVKRLRGA